MATSGASGNQRPRVTCITSLHGAKDICISIHKLVGSGVCSPETFRISSPSNAGNALEISVRSATSHQKYYITHCMKNLAVIAYSDDR